MNVVQTHCVQCNERICICGREYLFYTIEGKEKLTKAVNKFSIEDVFRWLEKKDYITDTKEKLYEEFKKEHYK